MKTILFALLFALFLIAMDTYNLQKNHGVLNTKTLESTAAYDIILISLLVSLILGLTIVYLIIRYIHVKRKNQEDQMIIKDYEDEVTNLQSQISYIKLKNKTLTEDVDERVLKFANENQILIEKNSALITELREKNHSNKILVDELNEKVSKAVKEKEDLFRQIEETIIFE